MSQNRFFQKILASGLLVFFTVTNHCVVPAYALPSSAEQTSTGVFTSLPGDVNRVVVPTELGSVEDFYQGKGNEAVILIQDAHAISEAQMNIRNLIQHFREQYGVSLVALEGAASQLDTQFFKSFPDKEKLTEVLKTYYEQFELTGGNAAAFFDETNTVYHGIEDWKLYEEGLADYLEAIGLEESILSEIENKKSEIDKEKQRSYSKELLEADQLLDRFYEDHANLQDVLQHLAEIKAPADGSELALLLTEMRSHESSKEDQTILEREVRRIAEKVRKEIDSASEDGRQLNAQYQDFQTSRITAKAFTFYLKGLVQKYRIKVHVSKHLAAEVHREKRIKDIKGTALFKEFETYATNIKESLFESDQARALDGQAAQLRLLERFASLEISHEDWEKIKSESEWNLISRDKFQSNFAFYENAIRRDQAFFRNLQSLLKDPRISASGESGSSAILVAGGFHTEGLTQRLKEQEISYLLLTPAIKSVPENTSYREQMQGKYSWSSYFEIENGKISFYKAFTRATRDKLLDNAAPSLIKQWRDQILRDLESQERIVEARNYTRFLDEWISFQKTENSQTGNKRIQNFIADLKLLDARGEITPANIYQILSGASPAKGRAAGFLPGTILQKGLGITASPADTLSVDIRSSAARTFQSDGITDIWRSEMRANPKDEKRLWIADIFITPWIQEHLKDMNIRFLDELELMTANSLNLDDPENAMRLEIVRETLAKYGKHLKGEKIWSKENGKAKDSAGSSAELFALTVREDLLDALLIYAGDPTPENRRSLRRFIKEAANHAAKVKRLAEKYDVETNGAESIGLSGKVVSMLVDAAPAEIPDELSSVYQKESEWVAGVLFPQNPFTLNIAVHPMSIREIGEVMIRHVDRIWKVRGELIRASEKNVGALQIVINAAYEKLLASLGYAAATYFPLSLKEDPHAMEDIFIGLQSGHEEGIRSYVHEVSHAYLARLNPSYLSEESVQEYGSGKQDWLAVALEMLSAKRRRTYGAIDDHQKQERVFEAAQKISYQKSSTIRFARASDIVNKYLEREKEKYQQAGYSDKEINQAIQERRPYVEGNVLGGLAYGSALAKAALEGKEKDETYVLSLAGEYMRQVMLGGPEQTLLQAIRNADEVFRSETRTTDDERLRMGIAELRTNSTIEQALESIFDRPEIRNISEPPKPLALQTDASVREVAHEIAQVISGGNPTALLGRSDLSNLSERAAESIGRLGLKEFAEVLSSESRQVESEQVQVFFEMIAQVAEHALKEGGDVAVAFPLSALEQATLEDVLGEVVPKSFQKVHVIVPSELSQTDVGEGVFKHVLPNIESLKPGELTLADNRNAIASIGKPGASQIVENVRFYALAASNLDQIPVTSDLDRERVALATRLLLALILGRSLTNVADISGKRDQIMTTLNQALQASQIDEITYEMIRFGEREISVNVAAFFQHLMTEALARAEIRKSA
jgi:hypothetical protein